jgi:signal transduction histidine kinase
MGTGGWVSPRRTEIVYESERTRVTRLFYPDRTLIRKEPLGPDAERRLEHETAVLTGLRGAAGLAQLAQAPWYPGSVLLVDAGRVNLAGPAKPLAADDLSWLALRLARALANLHDREVIHRDITPANVVLSDDGGDPCLVDFTLATSFAELGRAPAPRADLYGLGATLYELATGEPPFGYGPASRLLHDHLARMPAALSAVIMRLLEKDPDDRYQSAGDVARDLQRLRDFGADQRAAATRVGIPSAARALSSETSVERLQARVTEVLLRNAQLYAENRRIAGELAASRARIIAAADQARRRIERDLHDGVQQRLVSLALQLRQAQAAVPPGLTDLSAELDRAVTAANSALDEVGEIARGFHPAILTSGGLRPAVRALARRSLVPIRLQECTDRRLPEHVEVTAYYVIAEALTNATKHARAAAINIRVEVAGDALIVTIRDDGIGDADPARGTGLTGLKDRVEALGGVMRIESPPDAGTMLRAELPLTAASGPVRDDRYAQ